MIKVDDCLLDDLLLQATESPRKRAHYNLHKSYHEPVQRLCIALQQKSYVRPHWHNNNDKWELVVVLRGTVVVVIFDKQGVIQQKVMLSPLNGVSVLELPPNTCHSLYVTTDSAAIMEVKQGPYDAANAAKFASWAPKEEEKDADMFLAWLRQAKPGQYFLG
ncbi:WbuC family cupin fold metalloprotein [Shewanella waksmanii]|uniref:WbuC family cupin fold metalloprotein n=1 Tax=Shewanella waksmanii TaxID=213783 RepID=UPI0037361859